jgi:hypothetical protein
VTSPKQNKINIMKISYIYLNVNNQSVQYVSNLNVDL